MASTLPPVVDQFEKRRPIKATFAGTLCDSARVSYSIANDLRSTVGPLPSGWNCEHLDRR